MWGLLHLLYAAVYFAVAGLLLFKVKPIWAKGLVLLIAILIPNADDWYYRHKLSEYCANEAGYKIYQPLSPKAGLVNPLIGTERDGAGWLKHLSVTYLEWPEKVGGKAVGYWRVDRLTDGSISSPIKIPQYQGLYQIKRSEIDTGAFIEVTEQVVNRSDGTVAGEFKGLFYFGNWYPRALVERGGLVAGCGNGGQVVSRRDWHGDAIKGYEGFSSEIGLINRVFSKKSD